MMKLSIAMIVKNEEKNLEKSLPPLKELQKYIDSEIIILDTGSTDNTVEIAKKYTDKVYFYKWNNDFAEARNISIKYCTGDWVLVVDADEVLYDVKDLAETINRKSLKKYNSAFIKIVNFTKDLDTSIKSGAISPMLRLFRKDKVKYEGIVHEQPRVDGEILDLNIRFVHYGYNTNDYRLMEYKFNRNLELLMEDFKNNPEEIYTIFQISTSYAMYNQYKEALEYIELAYEKLKKDNIKAIYVLDKYCFILNSIKDYPLLLEKAEEALAWEEFIDFYYYKGTACYNLLKYDEAIKSYNKYLESYEKFKRNEMVFSASLSVLTRGLRDSVLYNLGICYFKLKKYKKALSTILEIQDKDILKNNINTILQILYKGKLCDSVNVIENFIDKYNYDTIILFVHKELSIEQIKSLLNKNISNKRLKEILIISKDFKENGFLNSENLTKVKEIVNKYKTPYTIHLYYILTTDFNEIYSLSYYGIDTIKDKITSLCSNYFEFNGKVLEKLKAVRSNSLNEKIIYSILERAILLAKKLPEDDKKNVFLSYISDKYYIIVKSYTKEVINHNRWMLSSEDRFILELRDTLSYKYIDFLKYVRMLKNNLNINKSYVDYIKLLIEIDNDKNLVLNNNIKTLIPSLINSIELLINNENYQDAYDTIEEGLSLVKFDFDLMILKYNLLLDFSYEKEAQECLRDIILYGDSEKVIELINNL